MLLHSPLLLHKPIFSPAHQTVKSISIVSLTTHLHNSPTIIHLPPSPRLQSNPIRPMAIPSSLSAVPSLTPPSPPAVATARLPSSGTSRLAARSDDSDPTVRTATVLEFPASLSRAKPTRSWSPVAMTAAYESGMSSPATPDPS